MSPEERGRAAVGAFAPQVQALYAGLSDHVARMVREAVAAERAKLARVAAAWRLALRQSGNIDEQFVCNLGGDFLDQLAAEFPDPA